MRSNTKIRTVAKIATLTAAIFASSIFVGCNEENSVSPIQTDTTVPTATSDAAESAASAIGEDNGGMVDQIGDMLDVADENSFNSLAKTSAETVDAVYDSVTGIWSINVLRERGNPDGMYYAYIDRSYTLQFLNENGFPQPRWLFNSDTAHTINFNIISGEGRHKTPRLSQRLKTLNGSFVVTNAQLTNVVVNGTYFRAAEDTITTRSAVRTLDHNLSLQISNLTGPRGKRLDLSNKISGTITGTYNADITFLRGDVYREKSVTRDILIVIGDGQAAMDVGGESYTANIEKGEILEN